MLPHINIGQLKMSTYYTAMILGYILMIVLMLLKRRREKYGLSVIKSVVFATSELICGVLGCKILFILENINWIEKNGFAFGGFSFYGAVFLIPLVMPMVGKFLSLNLRDSLDCSAMCIIAMLGTIRIGCFLNGCCGGRVFNITDFYFTFPTQLIECACDFYILFIMIEWEKKNIAYGFFYPRFLLIYGIVRFMVEFLRNTEKDWLYLSHAQWFSIAAIMIGSVLEIILRKQMKSGINKQKSYS